MTPLTSTPLGGSGGAMEGKQLGSFIVDAKFWADPQVKDKIIELLSLTEVAEQVKHIQVKGVSPLFEECKDGDPIPWYDLQFTPDGKMIVSPLLEAYTRGEQDAPASPAYEG